MQNKSEQFKRAEALLLQELFGYSAASDAITEGCKLSVTLTNQALLPMLFEKLEYEQKQLSHGSKFKKDQTQTHTGKANTNNNSNLEESNSELSEQVDAILQSKQEKKPGIFSKKNKSHARKDLDYSWALDSNSESDDDAAASSQEQTRQRSRSMRDLFQSSDKKTRKRQFSFSRSLSKDSDCSNDLLTEEELSACDISNENSDENNNYDLQEFEENQKNTLFSGRSKKDYGKKLTEQDATLTKQAEHGNNQLSALDPVELSLLVLLMILIRPRLNPILSLDLVNHPINSQAAQVFCEIEHTQLIQWLQKLDPEIILFQKGDGEKLFFRLKEMQQKLETIEENQELRPLDLLNVENYHYYKTLFEENDTAKRYRLMRMLQNIPEEQYCIVSIYETKKTTYRIFATGYAESFFDFRGFDDPSTRKQQNMVLPANIQDELERASIDWEKIPKIRKSITIGKSNAFEALNFNLSKQTLINKINFKHIKPTSVCYKPTMEFLKQVTYQPKILKLVNYDISAHDLAIILLKNGKMLVELDLSSCTGITDKVLKIISKHCTALKLLRLDSTTVSTIMHSFPSVMYLSLRNCPLITNNIFVDLPRNFPGLINCDLSETVVSEIKTAQHFTHLTLNKCKGITNKIFDDIKNYCKRVRSLSVRSTSIYEINPDANIVLSSLDISGCNSIYELTIKKSALVQLNASQCPNLSVIKVYDTTNLATVIARHCSKLQKVFLAPKKFSLALSMLDFDHCINLEAVYAKPIAPKIVRIENCPSLSHSLDDRILKNLMTQIFLPVKTKRQQTRLASTLGLLSRLCYIDFPLQIMKRYGSEAFAGKDLSGMDASGGNWEDLDLSEANLQNTRWVNTKLSGCILRGANLSNARFGQYSIWEMQSDCFNPTVSSVAFNPNSALTAIGHLNKTVTLRTKESILHSWKMAGAVYTLSFSPDKKLLAVAGNIQVTAYEHNIHERVQAHEKLLRNLEGDIMLAKVNKHISQQEVILMQEKYERLKKDGPYVPEDGLNYSVIVLSTENFMKTPLVYRSHTAPINQVCYSPNGEMIATCSDDGWVRIRHIHNQNSIYQYQHNGTKVTAIDWHSSGQHLVSASINGQIILYDTSQNKIVLSSDQIGVDMHTAEVRNVRFVPKLDFIVTNSLDKTVKIWKMKDLAHLMTWQNHKRLPSCLAVSPDGKFIASGESSNKPCKIYVWDIETGEKRQELVHSTAVTALKFENYAQRPKDGWTLFAGSANGNVHRWVIDTDSCRQGLLRNGIYRQFQADLCDVSETTGLTEEDVTLLTQMDANANI